MDEREVITRFAEHLMETAISETSMCQSALLNIGCMDKEGIERIESACATLEYKVQIMREELTQKIRDLEAVRKATLTQPNGGK